MRFVLTTVIYAVALSLAPPGPDDPDAWTRWFLLNLPMTALGVTGAEQVADWVLSKVRRSKAKFTP